MDAVLGPAVSVCVRLQGTGGENKASGWHPQRRPGRPGSPRVTEATVCQMLFRTIIGDPEASVVNCPVLLGL